MIAFMKKIIIYSVLVIILGFIMALLISRFGLLEGSRPDNLGIHANSLYKCPEQQNCVVSHINRRHSLEYEIDPLPYYLTPDESIGKIRKVLLDIKGIKIIIVKNNYLYAECKTPFLGFIDDFEVYCDKLTKQCLVRSASRLGFSDFGVNRKRIEKIRNLL